jgi:hypothetical protein
MGISLEYSVPKVGVYDIDLSHADVDVIRQLEREFPDFYPLLGPKGKKRSDVCAASLLSAKADQVLKLFTSGLQVIPPLFAFEVEFPPGQRNRSSGIISFALPNQPGSRIELEATLGRCVRRTSRIAGGTLEVLAEEDIRHIDSIEVPPPIGLVRIVWKRHPDFIDRLPGLVDFLTKVGNLDVKVSVRV